MKVLYFAWLRSGIGVAEEHVEPPPEVRDVAGLLKWLQGRGPAYAKTLGHPGVIRIAVNQSHARPDHPVAPSDEIALFPPVTGG
ncbi:MAG: molybdopterin converting factor subunit 1 [Rhodospirillaceae bacterium]